MSVLGFELEWCDSVSGQVKTMFLKYFLFDNTIEILSTGSTFLKRIYYPKVQVDDLYLGNTLSIHNRLFSIKGYANKSTREYMNSRESHVILKVANDSVRDIGKVLNYATYCRFVIGKVNTAGSDIKLGNLLIERDCIVIQVVTLSNDENASLNFVTGCRDQSWNVEAIVSSAEEIENVMSKCKCVQIPSNSTLCLIRPHAIKSRLVGDILTSITDENFHIHAMFSMHLTIPMIEEIFSAYRGVFKNYCAMIDELCAAPVIAMILTSEDGDTVQSFREFCGPVDPKLGQHLRPHSLRAKYGEDKVKNAVHCTDLPEDGMIECRYFFHTLASL